MTHNETVTAEELSQKLSVAPRTIQRDIEVLISKGIITREGGRKEGRWVVKCNKE